MPMSVAFTAGTVSSSADVRSLSVIPYLSYSRFSTCIFTRSVSSLSPRGRLPSSRFSVSPGIASPRGFLLCSPPRWGSRSVMTSLGSSPSPMHTSTTVPSFFTTTPRSWRGIVTHWYLRTPP